MPPLRALLVALVLPLASGDAAPAHCVLQPSESLTSTNEPRFQKMDVKRALLPRRCP